MLPRLEDDSFFITLKSHIFHIGVLVISFPHYRNDSLSEQILFEPNGVFFSTHKILPSYRVQLKNC